MKKVIGISERFKNEIYKFKEYDEKRCWIKGYHYLIYYGPLNPKSEVHGWWANNRIDSLYYFYNNFEEIGDWKAFERDTFMEKYFEYQKKTFEYWDILTFADWRRFKNNKDEIEEFFQKFCDENNLTLQEFYKKYEKYLLDVGLDPNKRR